MSFSCWCNLRNLYICLKYFALWSFSSFDLPYASGLDLGAMDWCMGAVWVVFSVRYFVGWDRLGFVRFLLGFCGLSKGYVCLLLILQFEVPIRFDVR